MPTPDHEPPADPRTAGSDDATLARLEGDVAAALDAGLPRPRPPFRASLRASFVSGRFEGDGPPPAVVARALDTLGVPPARPDARAAARAAFLAGPALTASPLGLLGDGVDRGDGEGDEGSSAAVRGARPTHRRRSAGRTDPDAADPDAADRDAADGDTAAGGARTGEPTRRAVRPRAAGRRGDVVTPGPAAWRRPWPRVLAAAVALAAAVLAVVLLRAPDARGWTAFAGASLAGVRVDGAAVTDPADLAARLADGGALETVAPLRLTLGSELVVELGAATRLWLPAAPEAGDLELRLELGAVRLATGADFRATRALRRLAVRTAHLEAVAVGTVFGVDCDAAYTCVCCLEGRVLTRRLDGAPDGDPAETQEVAAGRTRLRFADGRALDLDLVPDHRGPLVALAAAREV